MKPDSIAVEADSTDPWVVIVTADYQSLPDDDSAVEFWARTRVRFAPDGRLGRWVRLRRIAVLAHRWRCNR
jgi:hypothetical protein